MTKYNLKRFSDVVNESEQSFDDMVEPKLNSFRELVERKDKSTFMNEAFNEASYFMEMFKKTNEKEYLFTTFKIMDEVRNLFYASTTSYEDRWCTWTGNLLSIIKDGYAFQYIGNKLPLLIKRRLARPYAS